MTKRYCAAFLAGLMLAAGTGRSATEPYPLRDAQECRPRGGLPNALAKLEAGKDVRIAYLGGSITAQPGWRPKTLEWFRKEFRRAKIEEINAAIGGTGSDLGVFRLEHDVLRFKPDLLFVEFAVNDGGADPARIHKAMEGIVRQTWRANPETDICYVYTLTQGMLGDLQGGKFPRAASAMEALADYYKIPSIHMGVEVARLEKAGALVFKGDKPKTDAEKPALEGKVLFSPDGVHPYTESGHELYLQAVLRGMKQIRAVAATAPAPHELGKPFVADNWEQAKLVPLDRATLSAGWQKLDPATDPRARSFGARVPSLWKATAPGETMSFRFKGTHAGVYDLLGPDCGQLSIVLDDREPIVRPRFDGYCTYHRLATLTVGDTLPDVEHTVKITILPEQPDKRKILHDHRRPDFDEHPDKYDGTTWYAGALMLIGDLVE